MPAALRAGGWRLTAAQPNSRVMRLTPEMTGLLHHVANRSALDLLGRALAIAALVLVIFVGLPLLAALAG
jgi:hypothetical protein